MIFQEGDLVTVDGWCDGQSFANDPATVVGARGEVYELAFLHRRDLHNGSQSSGERNRYYIPAYRMTLAIKQPREKSGFSKFLKAHSL